DTYKFSLASPRPFAASLQTGTSIDVLLYRDANNNGVIDPGEFVTSTASQNGQTLLADLPAGNYFLRADAYAGGAGKYALTLEAPPDTAGNTLATAKNLGAVNGLYAGNGLETYVSASDTVDLYKFNATAAGTLTAAMA